MSRKRKKQKRELIQHNPKTPQIREIVPLVQQGRHEEAATLIRSMDWCHPDDIGFMHHIKGVIYWETIHYQQAVQEFEAAFRAGYNTDSNWLNYASALLTMVKPGKALAVAEEAVTEMGYRDLRMLFLYGQLLGMHGRKEESRKTFEEVVSLEPENLQEELLYAEALAFTDTPGAALHYLEQVDAKNVRPQYKMQYNFLLARFSDDSGDPERAWDYAVKANALQRQTEKEWDAEKEAAEFKYLIDHFPLREPLPPLLNGEHIVWIVGLPRSGTSVVEKELVSHYDIIGGGEYPGMRVITNNANIFGPYPQNIAETNRYMRANIGVSYMHAQAELQDYPVTGYITDKTPHNFKAIGPAQSLWRGATYINVCRDPMDVAASMFLNRITGHKYSASLEGIVSHITKFYIPLMAHYNDHCKIYNLAYSEFVTDHEHTLDNLRLPFTPRAERSEGNPTITVRWDKVQVGKITKEYQSKWRRFPALEQVEEEIMGAASAYGYKY